MRLVVVEAVIDNWQHTHDVSRLVAPCPATWDKATAIKAYGSAYLLSQHCIYRHSNGIHLVCSRCQQWIPKSKGLNSWLALSCLGNGAPGACLLPSSLPVYGPHRRVSGKADVLQKVCASIAADHQSCLKASRATLGEAAMFIVASFATQAPRLAMQPSVVDMPPALDLIAPWMMGLHKSHKLWVVGGLAFCQVCGIVATRPCKGGLRDICRKFTCEKPLPRGSKGRLSSLLKGKLLVTGHSDWPDGTAGDQILVPKRFFPRGSS